MTYTEQAHHLTANAQIAVMILLAEDNSELRFWRVRPTVSESSLTTREEFERLKLRNVGLIGLCGLTPMSALKEPLPPYVVDAISASFLCYVEEHAEAGREAAEVAELYRMWNLPGGHA